VWVDIDEVDNAADENVGANGEIIEIEELKVSLKEITSLGVITLEFNQEITLPQEFIDVLKDSEAESTNSTTDSRELTDLFSGDLIDIVINPSESALDFNSEDIDKFLENMQFTYSIDEYDEDAR